MGQGAEDLDMEWARESVPKPKSKNHHRANHLVNEIPHLGGFNVCLTYKGYEVSLAADGENTHVYKDRASSDLLFAVNRTTGESVLCCFQFIDNITNGRLES